MDPLHFNLPNSVSELHHIWSAITLNVSIFSNAYSKYDKPITAKNNNMAKGV